MSRTAASARLGWVVAMALAAGAAGCRKRSGPERVPTAAQRAALSRAEGAAAKLQRTLQTRLLAAMAKGGPIGALRVCADEAQRLTGEIARTSAVRVGRSSLRLRNPGNTAPPWVQAWLKATGERALAGVRGFARIDETPRGPMARVLRPLGVKGACVLCHGAPSGLVPGVREVLAQRYPRDRATGYRPGDLRGALWAETPAPR